MRTRSLGRTGLQVSEIAFGGIPVMTRPVADAVAVLRRALELGVSYFDTARGYGDSEVKMGRALAGRIFDCRRCGDCLPCPKGIDIVSIMIGDSLIMRMGREIYENRGFAQKLESVHECYDCEECLPKCPAGLNIPELLTLQAARIRELAGAGAG